MADENEELIKNTANAIDNLAAVTTVITSISQRAETLEKEFEEMDKEAIRNIATLKLPQSAEVNIEDGNGEAALYVPSVPTTRLKEVARTIGSAIDQITKEFRQSLFEPLGAARDTRTLLTEQSPAIAAAGAFCLALNAEIEMLELRKKALKMLVSEPSLSGKLAPVRIALAQALHLQSRHNDVSFNGPHIHHSWRIRRRGQQYTLFGKMIYTK